MIACTKSAELIQEDLWGGFLFCKIKTWNYTGKKLLRSRFFCKCIRVFSASWERCSLHNLIKNTVHLRIFLKIASFGNIFRKESMINYVYSSVAFCPLKACNFTKINFPENFPNFGISFFRNIFSSVEELNYAKNYLKFSRGNYTQSWLHYKCLPWVLRKYLKLLGKRL